MFERLIARGAVRAERRRQAVVNRLLAMPAPRGVSVERADAGVALSGRRLRRRMIADAALRNFAR